MPAIQSHRLTLHVRDYWWENKLASTSSTASNKTKKENIIIAVVCVILIASLLALSFWVCVTSSCSAPRHAYAESQRATANRRLLNGLDRQRREHAQRERLEALRAVIHDAQVWEAMAANAIYDIPTSRYLATRRGKMVNPVLHRSPNARVTPREASATRRQTSRSARRTAANWRRVLEASVEVQAPPPVYTARDNNVVDDEMPPPPYRSHVDDLERGRRTQVV
jgi:hypothetical protein